MKGSNGEEGNEAADRKAKMEVEMDWRMHKPDIMTPAGIRQAHPLHPKAPAHLHWSTKAIKDLVYMVTDKSPQRQWLWEIGKAEDPQCLCDGWTAQNVAHLLRCPWVGNGIGRSVEKLWEDGKWCERVFDFLL